MLVEMVTKHDLEIFKQELLTDFAALLNKPDNRQEKEFVRTKEARKLLGGISSGTLQTMRVKGELNPSKIGGNVFFIKYLK